MGPAVVEPTSVLTVMRTLALSFERGETLDAPAVGRRASLPDPVVRLILGKLLERSLVHQLDSGGGPNEAAEPRYALARAPQTIRVAELLEIGHQIARRAGDDGVVLEDPVIERLHQAQLAAVVDETLAAPGSAAPEGSGSVSVALPSARPAIIPITPEPNGQPHSDSPQGV
jgi:hypothetical protein